jgi:hypothetical protein
MRFFDELGRRTEERWRAEGYREDALPDVALRVFDDLPPCRHLGLDDIVTGVLHATRLEPSAYGALEQRILIPYHGRRFYLEVIFWVDEIAFPHHHSFSGAFHVLSGPRLHATYRFEEQRRVTSGFRLGRLELAACELLATGDARPIHAGSRLIHALSHLERPSLSVVIATAHPVGEPQLDYEPPFVAFCKRHTDRALAAQLQSLALLHAIDPARHAAAVAREVARADLHSTFELLRHAAERDETLLEAALGAARAAHGVAVDRLAAVLGHQRHRRALARRHAALQGADDRLLQALLLHVPSRAARDAIVRSGHADPASLLARLDAADRDRWSAADGWPTS